MQENKVTGKKYRILVDAVNDIWDRISFWTKSTDVEMEDGNSLETKMNQVINIQNTLVQEGDTHSNEITEIQQSLSDVGGQLIIGGTKFFFDYQNGKFGFNTDKNRSAGTFHPFRSGGDEALFYHYYDDGNYNGDKLDKSFSLASPTDGYIFITCFGSGSIVNWYGGGEGWVTNISGHSEVKIDGQVVCSADCSTSSEGQSSIGRGFYSAVKSDFYQGIIRENQVITGYYRQSGEPGGGSACFGNVISFVIIPGTV